MASISAGKWFAAFLFIFTAKTASTGQWIYVCLSSSRLLKHFVFNEL